ncbi:MAG: F0F1 ATP synthase subunit B [Bacteroidales bacterium]|nr:F0F1 ATP synthase subunit B [Bacteroidales bacterium]MCR5191879.1 F0F1 ATP synthase subunit B [Bacteroidales bacterium]
MNNPLVSPGLGVIFWMLVSFGILAFILMKWGWPVVLKALDKREKDITDALNSAEKVRQEMALLKSDNEKLLAEAKLQRDEILRNARLTGEQLIEEARQKATVEADRIVESARENINYEKLKAMHDLKNQIATLSIEIAEKLIKSELSDKERANDFVKKELENAKLN